MCVCLCVRAFRRVFGQSANRTNQSRLLLHTKKYEKSMNISDERKPTGEALPPFLFVCVCFFPKRPCISISMYLSFRLGANPFFASRCLVHPHPPSPRHPKIPHTAKRNTQIKLNHDLNAVSYVEHEERSEKQRGRWITAVDRQCGSAVTRCPILIS